MADDRYSWLDKDAAERLLRGEPAGSQVGDGARELEQLLKAAAAAGSGLPETAAAPGEEAALAAFRQARPGAGARGATAPGTRTTRTHHVVERTGLARPFRRGFAVALAVCAIGGIAVAAGTGVLPTPFRGGEPRPGASVSAAESPSVFGSEEPAATTGETGRIPATPPGGRSTVPGPTPTPDSSHGTAPAPGSRTPGAGTSGNDGKPLPDGGDGRNKKRKLLLALCKDYEAGKRGDMDRDTLRRLEATAGGAEKVHAFCRQYLGDGGQQGGGSGDNDGGGGGQGENGGNGGGHNGGGSGDEEGDSSPSASPTPSAPPASSTPAPTPSTAVPTPTGTLPAGQV
ncbi:hypothetical protein [Streptomyces noursei]|uniref:hypothetical protein n=1 Tax=Streptomyces noursei TaxID=1971 RepID=UPI00167C3D85|nr:hypothetical protein [Streptomyces noursei]MCZ1017643.1 hypothetical protein [Streptomyces noursei]GGX15849.1 hypothetical protein GCM10010341_41700 [Streptomyces noursei]